MGIRRSGLRVLFAGSLLFTAACATTDSEGPMSGGTPGGPAVTGRAGDSLDACLARIPKDASAGQRMVAEQSCQRDQAARNTLGGAAASSAAASGTADDSLKACLARIPQDASAGQRMIAEQSCERDEAVRKSLQRVPGAR